MRWILGIGAFVTLAACEPPIPDSAAGVTFEPRISDESTVATDLRPAGSVGSEELDVLNATAPQGIFTVMIFLKTWQRKCYATNYPISTSHFP